jgi:predicted DNA-binding transcriptional regulator YafY
VRRTLELFRLLRRQPRMSTASAAAAIGCDKDKARNDLRALEAFGLVQREGEGHQTRWFVDTTIGLADPAAFDEISLLVGRDLASFLEGTALIGGLRQVTDEVDERARRFDRKFRHRSEPARRYAGHHRELETVLHALLDEVRVEVTAPREGGLATFVIEPLTLVIYRRALYLLAREPGSPEVMRLAIDQLVRVRPGERFTWPEDWDPDAALGPCFGILGGGPPETVVMRFQPEVAHYVTARTWHPSQRLRELPDGRLELRMVTAGRELVRFACEWGKQVEVVAPPWLREAVRDELRAALRRYD